ncbi:MAG: N-acyl-D-amino-acid deacylase [Myxococcota bacterium]|jgi:N-acyl-D-amino-acid deacylase
MSEHYDLLVRGGTLIDGTGAPRQTGDLAISNGKIAAMGSVSGTADREIDATDCIVSPGFVDIHTHYDAQVMWDRMLTISPWHGVTSVVVGNCGFGIAPTREAHRELILRTLENVEGMSYAALQAGVGDDWGFESFPQYLDAVENRGTAINFAALLGHTPLRMFVMGEESTEREATAAEIAQMQVITREALDAGAIGFATSKSPTHVGYAGRPVPSREASYEEICALASCLGEFDHGVMQATVGAGLFFEQFGEIAASTNTPVTWTALLAGMAGPGSHRGFLEASEKLTDQGLEVYPQVTCRPLNFEFQFKAPFLFESLPYFKQVSQADHAGKKSIYADEAFRAEFRQKVAGGITGSWEETVVAECADDPSLNERRVSEVAAERGVHPVDLVLDLALASDLEARFRMAVFNTDEDAVAELLQHPGVILGLSDAGAHASQLCDACFSTHLLSYWVREKEVLDLEKAVSLLTSRSADVFGIRDRGRLVPGLAGDLAIFNPNEVGCSPLKRVNDLPGGGDRLISDAEGIRAVVVNGVVVREEGADAIDPDASMPGQVLRKGVGA